jgi:hypothetical protein
MAGKFMGCFGGRSKRSEKKKRKIRYEGIEMGGKMLTLECTTPMPEEQELNAMFAELVVRMDALSLIFGGLNNDISLSVLKSIIVLSLLAKCC